MPSLVLVRGVPGAGKNTWASEVLVWYSVLSADMFFEKPAPGGGTIYDFDRRKLPQAHAWCQAETRRLLQEGKDVAVCNTFTQTWEMASYREIAEQTGATLNIVEMHTQFGNIHGVPPAAVAAMKRRWEEVPADWQVPVMKITRNWRSK
jgi:predicted kinase